MAQERVYRWMDDEGTTHYTAQPPADREYQAVRMDGTRLSEAGATGESSRDFRPMEWEETETQDEAAEDTGPDPEELIQRCGEAREQLDLLEQRTRIIVRDDDGEEDMLGDDERLELIDETRTFIAENC